MTAEILGYIAGIIVAASFFCKKIDQLRLVNSIGAFVFVIYGFMEPAYPNAALNIFVICLNIYKIKTRNLLVFGTAKKTIKRK
jgi:hypothetical protein